MVSLFSCAPREILTVYRIHIKTRRQILQNQIISWLRDNQIGWTTDLKATSGKTFVETLAGALWYIDGHHDGLGAQACHVPSMFNQFQGFNKPELHKKRKEKEVLRILKEMKLLHIHRNYLLFRLVGT